MTILLLPLALQPAVGFGLSNITSPFFPIYHHLSPSSHSQHLKISFYFFSPSFPGSPSLSHPFQFLSEDLFDYQCTLCKITEDMSFYINKSILVKFFPYLSKWKKRKSFAVYFLLGNSPASEFYMPTFQNTLSVPSS